MNNKLKNILIHLRFPFSVLLLPVFLFAYSQIQNPDYKNSLLLFFVLHLLVYPSSNGYNSYMDNDDASIGGLKSPPKVPKQMFLVSILMDIFAIAISFFAFKYQVTFLIILYILASRAYSYRGIRLKKYPVIGFLTVGIFQGSVIYILSVYTISNTVYFSQNLLISAFISFLLIGSGYPLSQIYQHKQDKKDNVKTLSMLLGINGTFIFSGLLFALLGIAMTYYFLFIKNNISDLILFGVCLSPVTIVFYSWMKKTFKNKEQANFENTMKMNKTGAWAINVFFVLLILKTVL
jgi:1,4-dihydroxy-2-naphthoate polyprenyltransferase